MTRANRQRVGVPYGRRTVDAANRRRLALTLRAAGLTYRQMGERMGVTDGRAFVLHREAVEWKREGRL